MRILITTNVRCPLSSATAGMELSSMDLVGSLAAGSAAHGWELCVVAHPDTRLPAGVTLVPAPILPCPPEYASEGGGASKWASVSGEAALQVALEGVPAPDLVHDQSEYVSVALAAWRRGLPYVRTVRLMPHHPSSAAVARIAPERVYISEYQSRHDRWGVEGRGRVMRDLVAVEPPPVPPSAAAPHAVSIGRVEPRKGHHLSAEIARREGLALKVVGPVLDPEYARRLQERGDVELLGERPREEVLGALASAQALVWCPTAREPGGRVVIESLRLGTPVLARAIGYACDLGGRRGAPAHCSTKGLDWPFPEPLVRITALGSDWPSSRTEVADAHRRLYGDLLAARARERPILARAPSSAREPGPARRER
ncbi:MAG TPA: glycosyltransferase [Longimicrobiaceae bacterium]|nr:glycosyltransferase [Longimicrobiaceae bacterium]